MSTCGDTTVTIEPATASGTNTHAISAPVTFIYPKQPPKDDGRMLALASLIGGVFDALLGGETLGHAQDAENTWKGIADNTMKPRGESELQRVDSERTKLGTFETDLKQQLTDWRTKADASNAKLTPYNDIIDTEVTEYRNRAASMWNMLPALNDLLRSQLDEYRTRGTDQWAQLPTYDVIIKSEIDGYRTKADAEYTKSNATCVDDAISKLCEFVVCGYTADYNGISTRARADAELAAVAAYNEACRLANRYNQRRHSSIAADIRLATITAAIGASAKAREDERQFAYKTNHDMRFNHAKWLEDTRLGRRKLSHDYDNTAIKSSEQRWQEFNRSALHVGDGAIQGNDLRWKEVESLAMKSDDTALTTNENRWKAFAELYLSQDKRADELSELQWKIYSDSALKSFREGGEMLASAAQAYQFLAASIRATAKQGGGGGGVAGSLALLATVLPLFSGSCDPVSVPLLGNFFPVRQQCCA